VGGIPCDANESESESLALASPTAPERQHLSNLCPGKKIPSLKECKHLPANRRQTLVDSSKLPCRTLYSVLCEIHGGRYFTSCS
jgi:hypothetical protein